MSLNKICTYKTDATLGPYPIRMNIKVCNNSNKNIIKKRIQFLEDTLIDVSYSDKRDSDKRDLDTIERQIQEYCKLTHNSHKCLLLSNKLLGTDYNVFTV